MINKLLTEQKKLSQSKKWEAALEVNEKLINLTPHDASIFRERSRYFRRLDNLDEATRAMATYIELKCNIKFCNLIEKISSDIKKDMGLNDISSTFKVPASGGFNFGVIEHESDKGDIFFTKIATSKVGKSEYKFYKKIRPEFSTIKEISPDLLHYYEVKGGRGISLLTFPKISGGHACLESDMDAIFTTYRTLSKIKYNSVKKFFKEERGNKIRSGSELRLSLVFSSLHKSEVMRDIFKWIFAKLKRLEGYERAIGDISLIEKKFEDRNPFSDLYMENSYCLMHGDFHQGNMLLSEDKKNLLLVDWPSVNVAPKGLDLTKVFRRGKWDFKSICENFLDVKEENSNMSYTEKCAFSFGMILTWINFMPRRALGNYDEYIGAAIHYINK